MKKTTRQQSLNLLKEKYKERYVTPLLFKFTRPPIMFDPDQVRLNKQLIGIMESLDGAELCPVCDGTGVWRRKLPHLIDGKPVWDYPFAGQSVDSRAYSNDICTTCFGDGIVFREGKEKAAPAKNGMMVRSEDVSSISCPVCHVPYTTWEKGYDKENGVDCLFASCHGLSCKIVASVFKIMVTKDDSCDIEG